MDLTRLRHIVAVARNQSFSRAAEEEGITQPALSRSIAAFEKRHGVTLFDRGRGGVHPTAVGRHVVERARQLLDAVGDLESSLKRHPQGEPGQVAIGLGPLMAGLFLPRIASLLLGSWPGIRVRTLVRPPDQLVAELLNDRIEMILGNNWNLGRVPGTEVIRLGRIEIAYMVRGNHPLAAEKAVLMTDLERFPMASAIQPPPGGARESAGSFVCDNFHVLRETVLASDCVWVSSPAFLAEDLRAGRIVQLTVYGQGATYSDIAMIVRRGRSRSSASVVAAEEIKSFLERSSKDG
ncbi:LysR family transcriptional regulator [Novosphingobium sp. TCA1]|uniref:LysR family transcriptional regulator n=1 Tax=Novosphingobium sp. TCA1 TaxID=2682474 RepID=UPI001308C4E4|nr:LysR family transcriptional regulator [Novosphingobium sp. TCA1]GFE76678.1 LysR family transcriptional regulator [Novosphingobium sp. TCA1]